MIIVNISVVPEIYKVNF